MTQVNIEESSPAAGSIHCHVLGVFNTHTLVFCPVTYIESSVVIDFTSYYEALRIEAKKTFMDFAAIQAISSVLRTQTQTLCFKWPCLHPSSQHPSHTLFWIHSKPESAAVMLGFIIVLA